VVPDMQGEVNWIGLSFGRGITDIFPNHTACDGRIIQTN
jgi:hypothetical protein